MRTKHNLAIVAQIDQAVVRGDVYWKMDEVEDRDIMISGLKGRVRYSPSFAYRQSVYERRDTSACALCGLFDRDHNHVNVRGVGMQLIGSGASFPEQAHISVFDEPVPLFASDHQVFRHDDGVEIGTLLEHPSVCYKITGESEPGRVAHTKFIMGRLAARGLSYNYYLDSSASGYIIPRTQRDSPSLGTKVGLSLAAGTHNGTPQNPQLADVEELKISIRRNCEEMMANRLAATLRETTIQGEDPATIYKWAA